MAHCELPSFTSLAHVAQPVDGVRAVVADEQGAVGQLLHVRGPPPARLRRPWGALGAPEPPRHKLRVLHRLGAAGGAVLQLDDRQAVADLGGPFFVVVAGEWMDGWMDG